MKSRILLTRSASASPTAISTVVLADGARPSGHASSIGPSAMHRSAAWPSVLLARSVIATRHAPIRRSAGIKRSTSSVSPLCDSAITTSSARMRPRSPCTASAGWSVKARVPVEASVAASFWPTSPALPIPVTITLPDER